MDAQDAFAHHALGHAYAIQGQIEPALLALERGVELAPNDPMANACYAMQLAASGRVPSGVGSLHALSLLAGDRAPRPAGMPFPPGAALYRGHTPRAAQGCASYKPT